MYPAEPFSAAAFMNSPSSCFRVSAAACGGAEAAGRAEARTTRAAKSTATTTVRKDFMRPPWMAADILPRPPWGYGLCGDGRSCSSMPSEARLLATAAGELSAKRRTMLAGWARVPVPTQTVPTPELNLLAGSTAAGLAAPQRLLLFGFGFF